jgi:GTPase SAR1 family protein
MSALHIITPALLGAAASWPLFFARSRRDRKRLDAQDHDYRELFEAASHNEGVLEQQIAHIARLEQVAARYDRLKERLMEVGVVETYCQPVLLIGPAGVGKTSLLANWQKPWSSSQHAASLKHTLAEVPIGQKDHYATRPHFADPDITTSVHAQLMLRVHDFPGELAAQELIQQIVQRESDEVRHSTGNKSGIVLVCMFDATEAINGISASTREYFTGELFQRLRSLTFHGEARLARLVLVFNKVDQALKISKEKMTDEQLRTRCFRQFITAFPELGEVCHRERICGVLTMLDNSAPDMIRGASAVLGEAARGLADAFGMGDLAQKLTKEYGVALPQELLRAAGGKR